MIASLYYILHPKISATVLLPKGECLSVWTLDEHYYTVTRHHWRRGSRAWQEKKFQKYTSDGFVEVCPGDIVVDVGAFLGEFSLPAAGIAEHVLAIEPDPTSYACLRRNVAGIKNISLYQMLLAESAGPVDFKRAQDPTENSLIDVDRGEYEIIGMESVRLDQFILSLGFERIDFLKIDGEGAEPEILKGCTGLHIDKIAVDTGRERFGSYTTDEVVRCLEEMGFETRTTRPAMGQAIVYGRQR